VSTQDSATDALVGPRNVGRYYRRGIDSATAAQGELQESLSPICTLRSLWCAVAVIILSEKSVFNLRIDAMEPPLSSRLFPDRR
jgi:hypothetical protein